MADAKNAQLRKMSEMLDIMRYHDRFKPVPISEISCKSCLEYAKRKWEKQEHNR